MIESHNGQQEDDLHSLGGNLWAGCPKRLLTWCVCLAMIVLISGCGGATQNQPVDESVAQETLQRVLDHWRQGGQADDCQQWEPAVVVGEPRWASGVELVGFQVREQRALDANLFVNVELNLKANGKAETTVAQYCVGTNPVLTVFRVLQPVF